MAYLSSGLVTGFTNISGLGPENRDEESRILEPIWLMLGMACGASLNSDLSDLIDFALEQSQSLVEALRGVEDSAFVGEHLTRTQSLQAAATGLRKLSVVPDMDPADLKPSVFLYGTVCLGIVREVMATSGSRLAVLREHSDLLEVCTSMVHITLLRAYT